MDIKYNVGEPVAVYAFVSRIQVTEKGAKYDLEIKDEEGKVKAVVYDLTDEDFSTVF